MEKIQFHIESLDAFGQGVHKENGRVVFIPKTLPGETGEARILAKKKGVEFGEALSFSTLSPKRQDSPCRHFSECPGCAYLHTSYEQEIEEKKKNLEHGLKALVKASWKLPPVTNIPAEQRFGYRNRIQLHFDCEEKKLGLLSRQGRHFTILPIPECLLPTAKLQEKLHSLHQSQWWNLAEIGDKKEGTLILKESPSGEVNISVDSNYSQGEFEQVNRDMNKKAKNSIDHFLQNRLSQKAQCLDLFGGAGNLSAFSKLGQTWVVDDGPAPNLQSPQQHYLQRNLYQTEAPTLKQLLPKNFSPEVLLVDPPRSGFKQLASYIHLFHPHFVVAMSCQSSTMIRDLTSVENYRLEEIVLLDFFPGTHHFETLFFLSRIT